MATEAAPIESTAAAGAVPADMPAWTEFRRSWVNVLIDAIQRLPGPSWLAYAVAFVPTFLLVASTDWLSGARPGTFNAEQIEWAGALVGSIGLIHYLDGVARSSLEEFSSTLDVSRETVRRLEYEMTTIPAGPALVLVVLGTLRTAEGFLFEPASEGIVGWQPLALAIRAPLEALVTILLLTLVYHSIRQLRLVVRIHNMPARVNLFRPAPLYAFSRLTSRTAIGLVPLVIPYSSTYSRASTPLEFATSSAISGLILVVAALAFTVPLVGMHRRMTTEKKRLMGEVGERVEALIDELHGAVDRHDLSLADGQSKQLGSLIAERELVSHLSTWPWQAGTVGAVASAIILPVVLAFITRLLGRIV